VARKRDDAELGLGGATGPAGRLTATGGDFDLPPDVATLLEYLDLLDDGRVQGDIETVRRLVAAARERAAALSHLAASAGQERRARELAEAQQLRAVRDFRSAYDRAAQLADQLDRAYLATITTLARAIEARDGFTGGHVERVRRHSLAIGQRVGLAGDALRQLEIGGVLHDVGKIGIPDKILLKPGRLDSEELDVMRTHAALGNRILEGSRSELLQTAATIALSHHEWWDGSGYPYGLSGEEIPLEGRIAAIGDVFDALTSNRVYRKGYPLGEAVELMASAHGTHFDPRLLDLFLGSLADVVAVGEGATVR
jgi:putative two-component system response regulator